MTKTFTKGEKVMLRWTSVNGITYGFIDALETDGTYSVYFPEIESYGGGYYASDFA